MNVYNVLIVSSLNDRVIGQICLSAWKKLEKSRLNYASGVNGWLKTGESRSIFNARNVHTNFMCLVCKGLNFTLNHIHKSSKLCLQRHKYEKAAFYVYFLNIFLLFPFLCLLLVDRVQMKLRCIFLQWQSITVERYNASILKYLKYKP